MSRRNVCYACIAVVTWAGWCVSFTGAQTVWHVDDNAPGDPGPRDPDSSDPLEDGSTEHPFDAIQEGIDAASDGDTVLVSEGEYYGNGNNNLDFHGKAITVRSSGWVSDVVIYCGYDGRAFHFHSGEGEDSVVQGFTITAAHVEDFLDGAILCEEVSPTIAGCYIINNTCTAIYVEDGSPVIQSCTISGNLGGYFSGGIACDGGSTTVIDSEIQRNAGSWSGGIEVWRGDLTLEDCEIKYNLAGDYIGGPGGIAVEYADVVINNCVIEGNVGGLCGGGICASDCTLTLTDSVIARNFCDFGGGGLYSQGGETTLIGCVITDNCTQMIGGGVFGEMAPLILTDCTIAGNTTDSDSGSGGGLFVGGAHVTITGCTITENAASDGGGGEFYGGPLTFTNSTIAHNAADRGGGATLSRCIASITNCAIVDNTASDTGGGLWWRLADNVAISNCFVWGNSAPTGPQLTISATAAPYALLASFSDIEGGEADVHILESAVLDWGPGNLDVDPLFVDPVGGDYHLLAGSPCIDAGCNCGVPWDEVDLDGDGDTSEYIPFDLDGDGRFFDDPNTPDSGSGWPPIIDIGPYEFGGSDVPPCFGDIDGDGTVGLGDLAVLLDNYGTTSGATGTDGDMNCDGRVSLTDLAELLGVYGSVCD